MSADSLDFQGIEEILENPQEIEEPERQEIMERINRFYCQAREYDDLTKKRDCLEWAYKEKQRYEWELGVLYENE